MEQQSKSSWVIYLAGIAFIVWGILGVMDAKNFVDVGFSTGDNNDVNFIVEGSPAEAAGFEVGDVIKMNGGIDANDNKALAARPRAKAGDVREYVVDRGGEEVTLSLEFTELNEKDKTLNWVAFAIGLIFVLLGVLAHQKHKSALSHAFALFALFFGFLFFNGPHVPPGTMANLVNSISSTIVLLSFAYLLLYMLKYPPQSNQPKWIFIPALLVALMIWVLNFLQPDSSGSTNMAVRLIFAIVIIGYFLVSLVTLFKKYRRSSAAERSSRGLNLMLWGGIIGLLPILISFTVSTVSPGTRLPGNDYIFISMVAIPLLFSMALNKASASA